jgi:hypothetical protein
MKIEFVSGNFKLVVDGELHGFMEVKPRVVDETAFGEDEALKAAQVTLDQEVDAMAEVVEAGLTYIIQRDVASKAYLALAGVEGKGGKKSLPKFLADGKTKWSRDQVAYTSSNASTFAQIAEAALARYGSFTISVTEHIKEDSGTSPMKIATGMVEQAYAGPVEKLVGFLALVGADENASKEEQIAACHKWLMAFRK